MQSEPHHTALRDLKGCHCACFMPKSTLPNDPSNVSPTDISNTINFDNRREEMSQNVPVTRGLCSAAPALTPPTRKGALQMCRCKHYSSISRDLKQHKQYLSGRSGADRQERPRTCSGCANRGTAPARQVDTTVCTSEFDCFDFRDVTISNSGFSRRCVFIGFSCTLCKQICVLHFSHQCFDNLVSLVLAAF